MPTMALAQVAVQLRPEDNVAVVARPIAADTSLDHAGAASKIGRRINTGHKLALAPIKKGAAVYQYGQIIGFASQDIAPGDWVHVHNVNAELFERDYASSRDCPAR